MVGSQTVVIGGSRNLFWVRQIICTGDPVGSSYLCTAVVFTVACGPRSVTVLIVTTRQKGAGRRGAAPETTSIRASRPTTRTLRGSLRPALGSRRSSGGDTDLPLDSSDDDIVLLR